MHGVVHSCMALCMALYVAGLRKQVCVMGRDNEESAPVPRPPVPRPPSGATARFTPFPAHRSHTESAWGWLGASASVPSRPRATEEGGQRLAGCSRSQPGTEHDIDRCLEVQEAIWAETFKYGSM
jgi:hypothetical protein